MDTEVVHHPERRRFEVELDGGEFAELTYTLQPGTMSLTHTYVPRSFEGRGIAGRMTREALEYAERNRLEVIPLCSFAVSYMARHARKSERT